MSGPDKLQVYEVVSSGATDVICIVRCVGGIVRVGATFTLDSASASPNTPLRLDTITRYGQDVDLVDPPHSAKVRLTGSSIPHLVKGSILSSALPTPVNHQELDVTVTAVAPFGSQVDAGGTTGFIDQAKHPSWWSADVAPPQVGDRLHAVVLDDSRQPPRLSALRTDVDIARKLRGRETSEPHDRPPRTADNV